MSLCKVYFVSIVFTPTLTKTLKPKVRRRPLSILSGRVYAETVGSGSIPGLVKPSTIKIHWYSQILCLTFNVKRDSAKPPRGMVNSWTGGSLTRKLKYPFSVFWPRQLGK